MNRAKKLLALLLAVATVLSTLPVAAFAEELEDLPTEPETTETAEEPAEEEPEVSAEEETEVPVKAPARIGGTAGNLEWDFYDGTLVFSGTGRMPDYKQSNTRPWFGYRLDVTSVVIEEGVTYIGQNAFVRFENLASVELPSTLTAIGNDAFLRCISLDHVVIPEGVTSIGDYAFNYTQGLADLVIPSTVTSVGKDAFADSPWQAAQGDLVIINGILICYQGDGGTVTIPNTVTSMMAGAFSDAAGEVSVIFPDTMTSIPELAFEWCQNVTEITLPDSVTTIGRAAFHYCTGLTRVNIPSGVTKIPNQAFCNCQSLTSIVIPDGVTTIGNRAFDGCSALTSITIPDSVTKIDEDAFYYCESLKEVTLPSRITTIAESTFDGCAALEHITVPQGVKTIGALAFRDCESLKTVTVYPGLTKIAKDAFSGCSSLTDIYFQGTRAEWGSVSNLDAADLRNVTIHFIDDQVLDIPALSAAVSAADGVAITWEAVENAEGYYIYRKLDGEAWTEDSVIANTTALTYLDEDVTSGTAYVYTVAAHTSELDGDYDEDGLHITYIAPTAITGLTAQSDGIQVTWSKVNGAAKYAVLRKTGSEDWKTLGTTASQNWTDKTAEQGKTYTYSVRCVTADGKTYTSDYAPSKTIFRPFDAPAITGLTAGNNGIQITWSKVNGAAKYAVLRKTGSEDWKTLGTTASQNWTDKTAERGKTYTYSVRCVAADGSTYTSDYAPSKTIFRPFDAPSITGLTAADSGIQVTWSKVSGAAKYAVLRKTGSEDWKTLGTTASQNWTDKTAERGKTYTYSVRCVAADGSTYTSDYAPSKTIFRPFGAPTITGLAVVDSGIQVTWSKVEGAAKYAVLRKTGSEDWKTLGTTASQNWMDKTAERGKTYTYSVRCVAADGKTYTSDYAGEKEIMFSFDVPSVTALTIQSNGIKLTWSKVEGAARYAVLRKNGSGGWDTLGVASGQSWVDRTAVAGNTYTYTVRCVTADGKTYTSASAKEKAITYYFNTPTVTDLTVQSNGIKLTWSKVSGAAKYAVLRKNSSGGWDTLGNASGTGWVDRTAVKGNTYTYTVRCVTADGKIYTSAMDSTGKTIAFYLATPSVTKLETASNGIVITWGKIDGAAKYAVLRKNSSGGWDTLGIASGQSWVDRTAVAGNTYTYTVRCVSADGKTYTSSLDETGKTISYYLDVPVISSLEKLSGGVRISWDRVSGAAQYRVFRKTGNGGWERLGDTGAVNWIDRTAVAGSTYTYTIRCLSKSGSYASDYDKVGSTIVTTLATPVISKVENAGNSVQLAWSQVDGATKYRVFRKTEAGGWERLGDTASLSWTDRSVTSGTRYTYTVRCLAGDGSYASDYDREGAGIVFLAPPAIKTLSCKDGGVQLTWNAVSGAARYQVYRRSGSDSWTIVGETTAVSYTDTSAELDTTYSYTIRCYSGTGVNSSASAYDTVGKSISVPAYSAPASYSFTTAYRNGIYYKSLMSVRVTKDQRTAILDVARSQLGYTEGNARGETSGSTGGSQSYTEYGEWYYRYIDDSDMFYLGAWCSMFASWCANEAGIPESVIPRKALVAYMKDAFDEMGRYYTWGKSACGGGKQTIRPGDLIFFSTAPLGRLNHIGIVADVSYSGGETTITTIEGNKKNACRTMTYVLSTSSLTGYTAEEKLYIRGFACPNYGDQ